MSCILYDFTICAANCQLLCANVCAGKTNRKEGVRTSAGSGEIGIQILASRRRQVRLGSDAPQAPHSPPSPFESIISKNNRDSNSRGSPPSGHLGSDLPPAGHSLPSPFESIISKKIIGIRILASRRRSVRLGSDAPQAPHSLPSPFESL